MNGRCEPPASVLRLASASAPRDDTALLAAWREGDERAFRALFDRHRTRITSYAWQMVRRQEVAEEICTEAFCRVLEGAWSPGGSFRSFLYTVVHRLCLDAIRKQGRKQRALIRLRAGTAGTGTPEAAAEESQDRRRLQAAMTRLPEQHRATLLLYYQQELSSQEVAAVLGIADHQVRSRLSYARKLLRKELTDDP